MISDDRHIGHDSIARTTQLSRVFFALSRSLVVRVYRFIKEAISLGVSINPIPRLVENVKSTPSIANNYQQARFAFSELSINAKLYYAN